MFAMLERFVTLKNAMHKAITDIGDKNIQMTSDREIDMVREIVRCLNIIQLGAEACAAETLDCWKPKLL